MVLNQFSDSNYLILGSSYLCIFLFSQSYNFFQDMEERSEDDMILFERLLLLLRNILHVPSSPDEEMVQLL